MNWRPIKSAPKEGKPILVWATRKGWERSGYKAVVAAHDGLRWNVVGAGDCPDDRHWLDSCEPTQWMPLPDGPRRLTSCLKE
jgi:hypothetical protein